jgi:hypothetical protein
MAIKVYRKGHLAGMNGHYVRPQDLGDAVVWVDSETQRLGIAFHALRGTGKSHYDMYVEPVSFRDLAEAMVRADREEAIKAFGAVLQMGPLEAPESGNWVARSSKPKAAA